MIKKPKLQIAALMKLKKSKKCMYMDRKYNCVSLLMLILFKETQASSKLDICICEKRHILCLKHNF